MSVAPWWCNGAGHEAVVGPLLLHDAQGEQIAHSGARVLDLKMSTTSGGQVVIKEKFAVANVNAVIMSLGRLLRAGWSLRTQDHKHYLYNGSDEVEIQLRRNTMVVPAVVRAIGLVDRGPLPVVLEEITAGGGQGWHVLPSGLPVLIARQVEEIPGGELAWNAADWPWVAVFVRVGNKERACAQGDVWAQVLTKKVEDFLEEEKVLRRLDESLQGPHDVVVFFHVDVLPPDLLSYPKNFFDDEDAQEEPFAPTAEADGMDFVDENNEEGDYRPLQDGREREED